MSAEQHKAQRRARDQRAKRAARSDAEIAAEQATRHPDGLKECHKCHRSRPISDFRENRCYPDGLGTKCWTCAGHKGPWKK